MYRTNDLVSSKEMVARDTHTHAHVQHPCGEINKLKETEETYEVIVILEPYYHLNLNNSYL